MAIPLKSKSGKFNFGDYLNWDDNERWELINGVAYNMTPAPTRIHQSVSVELIRQIATFLLNHKCKVFSAPFDVRLPENDEKDDEITSIVQPDILVVCDENKLDDRGCRGAPHFVIEIASPSTTRKDQIEKKELYEKHGVREYWIVHPIERILFIRLLDTSGRYSAVEPVAAEGVYEVTSLPGLTIDFETVF